MYGLYKVRYYSMCLSIDQDSFRTKGTEIFFWSEQISHPDFLYTTVNTPWNICTPVPAPEADLLVIRVGLEPGVTRA
jgi:hypothetical protein